MPIRSTFGVRSPVWFCSELLLLEDVALKGEASVTGVCSISRLAGFSTGPRGPLYRVVAIEVLRATLPRIAAISIMISGRLLWCSNRYASDFAIVYPLLLAESSAAALFSSRRRRLAIVCRIKPFPCRDACYDLPHGPRQPAGDLEGLWWP